MTSIKKDARVAGFLYLLLVPLGLFGIVTPSIPAGPGDIAATVNEILTSETMYRLSIASALLVPIVTLFVAMALYKVLKPVNKFMARLMVIFTILATPIAMLNELNRLAALLLSSGPDYMMSAFTTEQLQALSPVFLELHQYGIAIVGIFWGLWLFPMGYLVFKSIYMPRIIGILLVVAGLGYLIDSFTKILLPDGSLNLVDYTFWGEPIFLLYLLAKGVNVEAWKKRVPETA